MPWRLVWRNLLAHPLRTCLTIASVAVAVFLLCVLRAVVVGLTETVEKAATNRLWVQSAVSLFVNLPLSYQTKIQAVDGVERVVRWQWFGGVYRDPSNFFAQFGVDPEHLLPCYPEMTITDGSYEAFAKNRTGCVIGKDLATQFGWEVGSKVPLQGTIFPKLDGSSWDFTVEAIYAVSTPSLDQKTLFFQFDYLRETLEQGVCGGPPGAGVYLLQTAPGAEPTRIMAEVDTLFENGPQRVQATTEAEFQRQFISMLGNIPGLLSMIGSAVMFAIFFAVLNTMLLAGRERTRDAGVMKALGFGNGTMLALLLAESVVVCGLGGLIGVGAALAMEPPLQRAVAGQIPGLAFSKPVLALGFGLALGVGVLAGLMPGWRLSRLRPVTALRGDA
ncbi:MAG: ABC transporter permease [Planctomycetota bacterium]